MRCTASLASESKTRIFELVVEVRAATGNHGLHRVLIDRGFIQVQERSDHLLVIDSLLYEDQGKPPLISLDVACDLSANIRVAAEHARDFRGTKSHHVPVLTLFEGSSSADHGLYLLLLSKRSVQLV